MPRLQRLADVPAIPRRLSRFRQRPPRWLRLQFPPETFRREFRFLRTDPNPELLLGLRRATDRAGERRTLQEAVGRKAFLSAAGMARTALRLLGWGLAPRRGKGAMRCLRGRFRACVR